MDLKAEAVSLFKTLLNDVNPRLFMPDSLQWSEMNGELTIQNEKFQIGQSTEIYVIGFGKASPTMAESLEKILGDRIKAGYIIAPPGSSSDLKQIKMAIGSHPIPDKRSIDTTDGLISFIEKIPDESIVLNLISGGASALLCAPAEPLTLEDLQVVFKLLIESGATIQEINAIRKSISAVKGGQLLSHLKNKQLFDLVISDIPDDDLKYIGSGPTTAQEISYTEAVKISEKYNIYDHYPGRVRDYLSGKSESVDLFHTGKQVSNLPSAHHSWIISSATKVAHKASDLLKEHGYDATIIKPAWSGRIEEFEIHISDRLKYLIHKTDLSKSASIFFGECTVEIKGDGLGGRNQEIALRMADKLQHYSENVVFLSAGTDGIDGPTDAAGAVVDQNSYIDAVRMGLSPLQYLQNNDSYHFFKEFGGHIVTGPTGNNVMDIQLLLLQRSE